LFEKSLFKVIMFINIVLLIRVVLGTLNLCSVDDDADIGCNAECVGPDHIICQLLRDDNCDLTSSVNMEINFEDRVTIVGVRVVFSPVSGTPKSISIGMTGTDTSDQSYDGTAIYSTEASTSSIVVSERLDLFLDDPYIGSNSWRIAIEISEGYIVAIESLTVYGGASPLLSEWGDWSKCACALQLKRRSCYSSSSTICNGYPLSESQACPTCTCSLNDNLYCSDFYPVSQSNNPGQTECDRIFDADEGTTWDYTFSSSSDIVDLTLEFRDTDNNENIYNMVTVTWNLTDSSDVDDLFWWLFYPSDSSASLTNAVPFKQSGPHAVAGTQRTWYWNIPIETKLIWLRFGPRETARSPYLGINEIHVTGFRTEDYPKLDCYAEEWIEVEINTSNSNQWAIPVVSICGGILLLMFCSWCYRRCCFKRKVSLAETPSLSNQLREGQMPIKTKIIKQRDSSNTGANGNLEMTQHEGPDQNTVFNGAGHKQRVSNNIPKRVTTLRDELPELPDYSSTCETNEEAEGILNSSISPPVSQKMPNSRISKIHQGSQRLEGKSQPISQVMKRIDRGSSIGRNSHSGSMEIKAPHPGVNSYHKSSVSTQSRISKTGKPVRILVSLGGDNRTFRPETYDCFVVFMGWVQDTYVNLPNDGNWRLEYQDSDGDIIRIGSDSDIREALLNAEEANFSKLRVTILVDNNNLYAPPPPQQELEDSWL